MPDLEVRPQTAKRKKVSLKSGETLQLVAFENGQRVQGAQWTLPTDHLGTVDSSSGVYTAPTQIDRSQIIKVTAMSGTSSGSTIIQLKPSWRAKIRHFLDRFRTTKVTVTEAEDGASGSPPTGRERLWANPLGIYLLLCLILILMIVTRRWEDLCPSCSPEGIHIYPPIVTLTPSQSQLFTANVPVSWSGNGLSSSKSISGLFSASSLDVSKNNKAQVVATRKEKDGENKPEAAEVYFSSKGGLSLQPSRAIVSTGSSVDLTAVSVPVPPPAPPPSDENRKEQPPAPQAPVPQITWVGPPIGTFTPSGPGNANVRFSVPNAAVDRPTTMLVVAQVADDPGRIAGAWVTLKPASLLTGVCEDGDDYDVGKLLLLLFLMGALGAIIHGISSFSAFVGNRDFRPSWTWWYIFKPFQGGVVALAVFLVFRAGFGVGNFSLDSADCLKSSAFAIMIGLFSELATMKLKDVFESIFTPRNDQRKDPLSGGGSSGPTLKSLDPSSVTQGQDIKTLTLHGTGFAPDCLVKIGSSEPRKPDVPPTATTLIVPLKPEDINKPGKVPVVVINKPPDGEKSNVVPLDVTEKK